ncbi:hypothetical protein [Bailinhaonella thermotolerans]|uniref:Uncharacterized protein n=1 Tax=Bailinhaonella thermotolerans TaxID=1070861 RepID=A0A3A4A1H0_9ACTN|nr:hypothetical protein [Bailinhaonella thermotolerans]RJL21112.1 hypothetical protein D5H75_38535 [Bailinhaonella thermotolerans]
MADFCFNVSLGRVAELYHRVKIGDPSGCALVIVALAAAGIESDAVLKDKDTLADVVAGSTNEATNAGYSRRALGSIDLVALAPDDVNDRLDLDIPDQTWTNVQSAGGAWAKLVICYRPAAASADSAIIPMTCHDFAVTPDGSNIVMQVDAAGFFRAT